MEYVPGRTLRELLTARGRLGARESLDIIEGVLAGLQAAHQAGIVHRDVKPENVLITAGPGVKVADFGLARAAAGAGHTKTGTIIGTAAYLAPEQVTRGVSDARSDVYAAGVMLFELLTGTQPHTGGTPLAVAYKHVNEAVPAPSSVAPGLPPALDALVALATSRDPELRPADAGQFLRAITAVRHGLPIAGSYAAGGPVGVGGQGIPGAGGTLGAPVPGSAPIPGRPVGAGGPGIRGAGGTLGAPVPGSASVPGSAPLPGSAPVAGEPGGTFGAGVAGYPAAGSASSPGAAGAPGASPTPWGHGAGGFPATGTIPGATGPLTPAASSQPGEWSSPSAWSAPAASSFPDPAPSAGASSWPGAAPPPDASSRPQEVSPPGASPSSWPGPSTSPWPGTSGSPWPDGLAPPWTDGSAASWTDGSAAPLPDGSQLAGFPQDRGEPRHGKPTRSRSVEIVPAVSAIHPADQQAGTNYTLIVPGFGTDDGYGHEPPSGRLPQSSGYGRRPEPRLQRWLFSRRLAYIAATLAVILILGLVTWWVTNGQYVTVPQVGGLTKATATTELRNLGFHVRIGRGLHSNAVHRGEIVRTDPAIGARAKRGSEVSLIPSLGPVLIQVPSVTGLKLADAEAALRKAGLTPGKVTSGTSSTIPLGVVISTSPIAGLSWPQTRPVAIVESAGPPLPSLVGQQETAAQQQAQQFGFQLNPEQNTKSDQPAGTITSQSPQPGTPITPGEVVTVRVSAGPQMVSIPNVDGLFEQQAASVLMAAGFQVSANTVGPGHRVYNYSPSGQAPKGSTITIFVGFGLP